MLRCEICPVTPTDGRCRNWKGEEIRELAIGPSCGLANRLIFAKGEAFRESLERLSTAEVREFGIKMASGGRKSPSDAVCVEAAF
ncbi:hypothetical protein LMG28614_06817 [Paraburkholderia ultramafica]|uniref:Uncharacterized protein n=1 Tax=Paraburkholderia ultramafica TaxID=1544867 RepID=A0A6S7BPU5_9BURK|nr:hypothetical protein LMG28614_06817 [Paraburkholderia ultramafica]